MYKEDVVLNNLQWLICHKTQLNEMKEEITKVYPRRSRNLLETNFCNRNLIKRISTWAVSLLRGSGPILNCTIEKLKKYGLKNKEIDNSAQGSNTRAIVWADFIWEEEEKGGGRRLARIRMRECSNSEIQRLYKPEQKANYYSSQQQQYHWQIKEIAHEMT